MASPAVVDGRITRQRYWQFVEDGVIGPDDRVELLEGVIVAMSPQSPAHAFVISKLNHWLNAAVGQAAVIRVQLPLDLSDLSTPEPDVAVVVGCADDYAVAHPTTACLVVEVAAASAIQDRMTKGPMYAAAGIVDYWLVNLRERRVEIFRVPLPAERRYAESRLLGSGDQLEPVAFPGVAIPVDAILPPV